MPGPWFYMLDPGACPPLLPGSPQLALGLCAEGLFVVMSKELDSWTLAHEHSRSRPAVF